MGKIAASAVKRSGEIAPSSTATLEQEDRATWDGTMMGRIVEWMTGDIGKDFSIIGGEINRGKREKDVAISEINRERRWNTMVVAGCRIAGIHWISDNTWVSENSTTDILNGNTSHATRKRLKESLFKSEPNGANGQNR